MLIYIAILYVLYVLIKFFLTHRNVDKAIFSKILKLTILEIVLVIVGILLTFMVVMGGIQSAILGWTFLILGVGCLIASGRIGMYTRKVSKESIIRSTTNPTVSENNQTGRPNTLV